MIHKTAIIDTKAEIASNVEIGPYCVIGPNVEIGEKTIIQSHVNISVSAKIGKGNKIYPFVSINDPQDLKYNGETTNLVIGDNNKIREYVTINPGTVGGGGKTIIGDNCFIGARSEVVEGVVVEDNVVISMGVYIGQSTKIFDRESGEVTYGRVPKGSVVVSGNLPSKDGTYSLYCAVIVKKVDEKTLSKVGINELLRGI